MGSETFGSFRKAECKNLLFVHIHLYTYSPCSKQISPWILALFFPFVARNSFLSKQTVQDLFSNIFISQLCMCFYTQKLLVNEFYVWTFPVITISSHKGWTFRVIYWKYQTSILTELLILKPLFCSLFKSITLMTLHIRKGWTQWRVDWWCWAVVAALNRTDLIRNAWGMRFWLICAAHQSGLIAFRG